MIKISDIKVGALIWWKTNRDSDCRAWDCPVIVTTVTKKGFRVKSLDDFKVSPELSMNDGQKFMIPTSRKEMRLCSLEEVKEYFEKNISDKKNRASEVDKSIKSMQAKLRTFKAGIIKYEETAVDFLKEVAKSTN